MTTNDNRREIGREAVTVTSFPLPTGALLEQGEVVGMTLTAYKVVTPEGAITFVPFIRVHRPAPATPLVYTERFESELRIWAEDRSRRGWGPDFVPPYTWRDDYPTES